MGESVLEIRFELSLSELRVFGRDGRQFVDVPELDAQREEAERRTERERAERRQAEQRAEREHLEAEKAIQKAERLAAQLRALGLEPEQ